jgi:predicted CXXCH cytochrome family protein
MTSQRERIVNFKVRIIPMLAAVAALTLAACVDDENPILPPELDAAFVGYSDPGTRQTTCGNCHVSKQRSWATTAHAGAWEDLQASGHASSSCNSCHTTNGTSNLAPDSAGFFAVNASAQKHYYDVQCESCHGPGGSHVVAPDDAQPLTTIAADTSLNTGCGTCHTGSHNPFISEWRSSRHGRVDAHVQGNASCQACHDGRAFIKRFDPDAKFTEMNATLFEPQTCATCHDPHGSDNPADLRLPINTADLATNLCMQCHLRRSAPDPTTSRGPHAPQGPMLLGEAGWRPSTFTTSLVSSHGAETNVRLCAGCHVNSFSATDQATNTTVYTTGHSFRAIPCTVPGGAVDTATVCADSVRTFRACTSAGCHSTENSARAAFELVEMRFASYVRQIWVDVDGDDVVDAFPADSGMLAILKRDSAAVFTVDPTITVAEGALFNARMMKMPGNGVHNPFYGEALMIASIDALRSQYALPVPPALVTQMARRASIVGLTSYRQ